jgi:hypothetical protein
MQFQRQKKIVLTISFGIAWIIGAAFGWGVVLKYDNAAGSVGIVPQTWPANSPIHRRSDRMTLVMLAHPRCPCTRASIGELAKIMATAQGKVDAYVLFFRPKGSAPGWDQTDLRRSAAAIPGVTVISDINGAGAHRFGAETSGHTLLFDRNGGLLFSGGITDSRGHAGGNKGESAIAALIDHRVPAQSQTLVFGCKIHDDARLMGGTLCSK